MSMLVIVAKDRPELFEQLVDRFRNAANVDIISERRGAPDASISGERRSEVPFGSSADGYQIILRQP
jgi:hypothetical protein